MTSLVAMEPHAVQCAEILVRKFTDFAVTHASVNLQVWLQYFAFDTIALITVCLSFPSIFPPRLREEKR